MSRGNAERDSDILDDYAGLFWRRPWLAYVFMTMRLSLAGIPLTMSFIGKFYVLRPGSVHLCGCLSFVVAVGSAIGIDYVLHFLRAGVLCKMGEPGKDAVMRE